VARTVTVDGVPDWLVRYLAAGVAMFLVLWGALATYSAATGGLDVDRRPALPGAFAAVWVAVIVVVRLAG